MLRRLSGAPELVLENVARRVFLIPFQLSRVATPVRNIMRKYSDLPVDFADACLIHLADELNTGKIPTLDRDFAHYYWRKMRRFDLLIDVKMKIHAPSGNDRGEKTSAREGIFRHVTDAQRQSPCVYATCEIKRERAVAPRGLARVVPGALCCPWAEIVRQIQAPCERALPRREEWPL